MNKKLLNSASAGKTYHCQWKESQKERNIPMKRIDCLGDICPVPIMRLQKEVSSIADGEEILLVTDHSCSCNSVQEFCKERQLHCAIDEVINGVWEITITKDK